VLSLFGPALSEGMIVVTGNPEGSHEALCTGVIAVPFPDSPFGIETIPLPPFEEWADPSQRARVWGLPRDTLLTISDLQAAGVRAHVLTADEVTQAGGPWAAVAARRARLNRLS
jgi:hypothetical protein